MTAPAAIRATFADYKRIRTRKLGQLIFEIPLEELHNAIETLGGEPSVEGDTWVAIARLVPETARPAAPISDKEKRKLAELSPTTQAALTCQRKAFWAFLNEQHSYRCKSEEEAAEAVREICVVQSRSELATNHSARVIWNQLLTKFEAWLMVAA